MRGSEGSSPERDRGPGGLDAVPGFYENAIHAIKTHYQLLGEKAAIPAALFVPAPLQARTATSASAPAAAPGKPVAGA